MIPSYRFCPSLILAAAMLVLVPVAAPAACCYFSAKNADILQPAQKAFLTWDPEEKVETFTVQPKFAGNALDFGMVIPTPAQPKLHEMPRDFFKHLAIYSIMKQREFPASKLLPMWPMGGAGMMGGFGGLGGGLGGLGGLGGIMGAGPPPRRPTVVVVEAGVVGSLDYKIIEATRADDLFEWLKKNKYSYSGDEATLNHYVQKKWYFTVMKIDTMQMKRNKDGTFTGEVTPTRFQFTSEKLVYPLKITQISVKDKTEALFYVQAPYKVDLSGDNSYQYTWVPMLQAASGCTPGGLPGRGGQWLHAFKGQIPGLLKNAAVLDYRFVAGQRPRANKRGHIPTTMEWARKLTKADVGILTGKTPYCEELPNVDSGFTPADLRNPLRSQAVTKVIQARLAKAGKSHPNGYLVRHAPADDVRALQQLAGHLEAGLFITKFRKIFARDEMNDDLLLVPARFGDALDDSEYEELLPVSPP